MNAAARRIAALAAFFGMTAVLLGAFAAHGLKARVSADMVEIFDKGARYQMYHALAMLFVALFADRKPDGKLIPAAWLFSAGIFLFSGSLYALVLTGHRWLGAITPIGGVCFIAGWVCLFIAALKSRP